MIFHFNGKQSEFFFFLKKSHFLWCYFRTVTYTCLLWKNLVNPKQPKPWLLSVARKPVVLHGEKPKDSLAPHVPWHPVKGCLAWCPGGWSPAGGLRRSPRPSLRCRTVSPLPSRCPSSSAASSCHLCYQSTKVLQTGVWFTSVPASTPISHFSASASFSESYRCPSPQPALTFLISSSCFAHPQGSTALIFAGVRWQTGSLSHRSTFHER